MLILSKIIDIHVYPRVTYFTCHVFYCRFVYIWDMYVFFSFDKIYIYLEVCLILMKLNFSLFHFFNKRISFWLSFIDLFSCIYFLHDSCTLHHLVCSWFWSMSLYVLHRFFECWFSYTFHILWNIYLFYSLLEGFRTSFQKLSINWSLFFNW